MAGSVRSADWQIEYGSSDLRGLSDERLAVLSLDDPARFEELYRRYADRIYRFALARTGSPHVADDVVGDVVVSAFESLDRFNPDHATFAAWIFTIASRRVADHFRAKRRLRNLFKRQHAPPDVTDDALSDLIRDDQRQKVREAIRRLPNRQREVVELRYIAELSIRDTCDVLNVSAGAVKMRLNRALKNLAVELGGQEDEH